MNLYEYFTLLFFSQELSGSLYSCRQGEGHQFCGGTPLTASHECEDSTLSRAIQHHLADHPENWDVLPWSCSTCGMTNPGNKVYCTRVACQADMERGRDTTLRTILAKMEEELLLVPTADAATAKFVTIQHAMVTILSPHNRNMAGLLEESFLTPTDPFTCACTAELGFDTPLTDTITDTTWPMELCRQPLPPCNGGGRGACGGPGDGPPGVVLGFLHQWKESRP